MENNDTNVVSSLQSSVQSMNESVANAGAPLHSLAECLDKHPKTRLSDLAKVLSVSKYSKLKKAELISAVSEKLKDIAILASILTEVDEAEFLLFTDAAENGAVTFQSSEHRPFHALHLFGAAAAFVADDVITVIVPDEIKTTWRELKPTGFSEEKLRGEMIHRYAAAGVNLYGALTLDALIVLIRRFEDTEVDIDAVKASLLAHIGRSEPYYLWNNYVVNVVFGDEVEILEEMLNASAGIPRYVPERDEFLMYESPVYYEDTPGSRAMALQLGDIIGDSYLAGMLTGDLRAMLAGGLGDEGCFRMLESSGIRLSSRRSEKTPAELLLNMRLETRLWEARGHVHDDELLSRDVGRNDKCPCGSGLKHKKCCGI